MGDSVRDGSRRSGGSESMTESCEICNKFMFVADVKLEFYTRDDVTDPNSRNSHYRLNVTFRCRNCGHEMQKMRGKVKAP